MLGLFDIFKSNKNDEVLNVVKSNRVGRRNASYGSVENFFDLSVYKSSSEYINNDKNKYKDLKYKNFYSPQYTMEGKESLLLLNPLVRSTIDAICDDIFKSYNFSSDNEDVDLNIYNEILDKLGLLYIFKQAHADRLVYGYGCLALERDRQGNIISFYHVPSLTVRVYLENETGKLKYVQHLREKINKFNDFGDVEYGTPELIFLTDYTPLDDVYGVSAFYTVLGDIKLLNYLKGNGGGIIKSYAKPQIVAWVNATDDNANVREDDYDEIVDELERRLNDATGELNSVVLTMKNRALNLNLQHIKNDIDITGYLSMEDSLESSVIQCVSMSPYRIGIIKEGMLGGTNIKESLSVYGNNIILNKQREYEELITKLLNNIKSFKDINFVFNLERFKYDYEDVMQEDEDKKDDIL